ncbi:hypothetical protein ACRBEV_04110 [Methylobacterium phyllosphaerae]
MAGDLCDGGGRVCQLHEQGRVHRDRSYWQHAAENVALIRDVRAPSPRLDDHLGCELYRRLWQSGRGQLVITAPIVSAQRFGLTVVVALKQSSASLLPIFHFYLHV